MRQARPACSRWTTDGHEARCHARQAQNSYSNVIGATGAKAADRSTKRLRAPGWCARTGGRVHLCQRTRTCACARESRARVLRAHRRIGIGVLRLSVKRELAWEAHRWGTVRSCRPCRSCAKPLLCAGEVLGELLSHEPFEMAAHAVGRVCDSRLIRRLEPSSADVVVRVFVAQRLQQKEVVDDLRWQLRLCVCRLQCIGLRRPLLLRRPGGRAGT